MSIYITREGTKLTAEFPRELQEKLYQAEPTYGILFEKFKRVSNSDYLQMHVLNRVKATEKIKRALQDNKWNNNGSHSKTRRNLSPEQ